MKRMIPLMLVVAMLLSMGLSAAATQTTEVGSTNVTANYEAGEEGGQIISVEIAWEGMEFTYNGASNPVWDPKEHKYSEESAAGWAESNASIAITNHSNVILQAEIAYSSMDGFDDMYLVFASENPYIGSAATGEDTNAGTECMVTIQAIPMGELASDTGTGTEVGQIKVTVVPVETHMTVLASLEGLCEETPADASLVSRGEAYFATSADKEDAVEYFAEALAEATSTDASSTTAKKNQALNLFITAYYNNLCLKQDEAVS